MAEAIRVQVCHATLGQQVLRELVVPAGSSIRQAILQSGILEQFPEIDLAKNRVGIFGKVKTPDAILRDQDRVEIYRPLIADPKETRRRRAAKK